MRLARPKTPEDWKTSSDWGSSVLRESSVSVSLLWLLSFSKVVGFDWLLKAVCDD